MTRKHFNELAAQLRLTRFESVKTAEQLTIWRVCCAAVALACRATSANFNQERFIEACERPAYERD